MARSDLIELEGIVTDVFPGGKFQVTVTVEQKDEKIEKNILCTVGGKLSKNHIRILRADRVTIQVSPYDLSKGIITWRNKG